MTAPITILKRRVAALRALVADWRDLRRHTSADQDVAILECADALEEVLNGKDDAALSDGFAPGEKIERICERCREVMK